MNLLNSAATMRDQDDQNAHDLKKPGLDDVSTETADCAMEREQPDNIIHRPSGHVCGFPPPGIGKAVAQGDFVKECMLSRMTLKGYGRTVHVGSKHHLTCFEAYIGRNKVSVLGGGSGVPVNEFVSFINHTLVPSQRPISMIDISSDDTFTFSCDKTCSAPPLGVCIQMHAAIELADRYGLRPSMEELRNYAIMYRPPQNFRCAHCHAPISAFNSSIDAENHGSHTHTNIWDCGSIYCCVSHRLVFFTDEAACMHGRDCPDLPSICHTGGHDASFSNAYTIETSRIDQTGTDLKMQTGYVSIIRFSPPVPVKGSYFIRIQWGKVSFRDLLAFCLGVLQISENGVTRYRKQDHPDRADEGSVEAQMLDSLSHTPERWLSFSDARILADQYGLSMKLAPIWGLVVQPDRELPESVMCTDCGMSIPNKSRISIEHLCQNRPRFPVDLYR